MLKINVFTFVGGFWLDPVLVLGRSTAVGDSGDVFTGVVAVNKIKHKFNKEKKWQETQTET